MNNNLLTITSKTSIIDILKFLKKHRKGAWIDDTNDTDGLTYHICRTNQYARFDDKIATHPKFLVITKYGLDFLKEHRSKKIAFIFIIITGLITIFSFICSILKKFL